MAMRTISHDALQELVLEQLKAAPGCAGARSVVIATRAESDGPSNWQVGVFDSGLSPIGTCRKAIAAIEDRLAREYPTVED